MFDSVGRDQQRQAKRQASAFLLSMLLNGSLLGGAVWAGSRVVEEVAKQDDVLEVAVDLSAPPPPPPPPPPAGGGKKPKTEKKPDEIKPIPEDVPQEVTPLEEAPKETEVVEAETEGVEDGVEGGVEGGVVGGVVGGTIGGVLGGQLGGTGVKVVHWTEAEVKVKAQVRASDYPEAANALKLPEQRCTVRLNVDEKGVPFEAIPKTCPDLFRDAAKNVALRYRFYPMKEAGRAVKFGFDIAINFKPAE